MKVPLLDLKAQYLALKAPLLAAAERVLESGHFILGPEVDALERSIATLAEHKHVIGMSSGTDALLAALMALGVGPGDEVITTSFSFFATVGAVLRLGAVPVFADVSMDTLNLDVDDALGKVTNKTRAIIPVHLFGRPLDVTRLVATGIPVVEDAAQALCASGVGKKGTITTYSFFPSKNLGAAGDAGAAATDDDALADRLRLVRTHGSRPKYVHGLVGGNFRLDALQAALLSAKLPALADWNARRRANMQRYASALTSTPLALPSDVPGHVWHHYVVRVLERRDALKKFLAEREIETEVYYPVPLHLQPCIVERGPAPPPLPNAERAAQQVLALPVHPDLSSAQIDHVIASVKDFFA